MSVFYHLSPPLTRHLLFSKLSYVYQCTGCESIELQRLTHNKYVVFGCLLVSNITQRSTGQGFKFVATTPKVDRICEHCGHSYQMGGPIWSEPIHSKSFITQLQNELSDFKDQAFGTHKRMHGLLQVVSEELTDSPLYYCLDRLCRVIQCSMPSMKTFRSALLNGGFQVSYSHANKTSVKTNASNGFIWDVMRHIRKLSHIDNKLNENSPGSRIMSREPTHIVSLEAHENAEPISREKQLLRYQVNPEPNWGPLSLPSKLNDKRALNQGKRSRPKDIDESSACQKKASMEWALD